MTENGIDWQWLLEAIREGESQRVFMALTNPAQRWAVKNVARPAWESTRDWWRSFTALTRWQRVGWAVTATYAVTFGITVGMGADASYPAQVVVGGVTGVILAATAIKAAVMGANNLKRRIAA